MIAAKRARTPARIVTVSPAEWNRHRQQVIAKRNAPPVTAPFGGPESAVQALLSLMRSRINAQLTEERLFRHIEECYRKSR
jgi:hypothetical protein